MVITNETFVTTDAQTVSTSTTSTPTTSTESNQAAILPKNIWINFEDSSEIFPIKRFTNCLFGYGRNYEGNKTDYSTFDYISFSLNTIKSECAGRRWLDCTNFDNTTHGEMLKTVKTFNKTALFYINVIATEAQNLFDIEDCETRRFEKNLCTIGSEFIRNNRLRIIERYDHQSKHVAAYLGKYASTVFLIENDFW